MSSLDHRFLLLTSKLGDPNRVPLTTPQLHFLAQRMTLLQPGIPDEELTLHHLLSVGIGRSLALKTLRLLEDQCQLEAYLKQAQRSGCTPITRENPAYPLLLRKRLGNDAPGCLWAKGNREILKMPAIALVGSRDLNEKNSFFAQEVGRQAAKQGFALVSGNARGADTTAQNACLSAGGYVISVVSDTLTMQEGNERILYISENDYDERFSALRALQRNHTIHALGIITFVAQCTLGKGGTWDGSVQNLTHQWSPLFCFQDGSPASVELEQMGAQLISTAQLEFIRQLEISQLGFL